jgi:L-gulonolactone oxidase
VLREIDRYLDRSGELIGFPVEVRFAAADDVWLSTAHGRETGYVAVHQYHRRDHAGYFAAVEAIARSVDGRPHWGKLHGRSAVDLRPAYPHFDDFLAVRDKVDPERRFANPHLDRILGA